MPLLSLSMLVALSLFVKLSELYEPELEIESFSVEEDELDEGECEKPGDAGGDTDDEGKLRKLSFLKYVFECDDMTGDAM